MTGRPGALLRGALAATSLWLSLAAQSLTTTFAHDNGGAIGGAVYYDLTVLAPNGITLTRLDLNFSSAAGTPGTVDVLTHPGPRAGSQTSPGLWTLAAAACPVIAAGPGQPSMVPLVWSLPAGTHAVCLRANGLAHAYTNGGTIPQVYANADLSLAAGEASHVPFVAPVFSPRIVNATHTYVLGAGAAVATNTTLGQGCGREFASFYESLAWAGVFDLNGASLHLVPNGGGYTVSLGATWLAPGTVGPSTALSLADDDEVTVPLTAMGSFPWRTGATSSLTVCSNGFVSAAPGNGVGFTPTVAAFLGAPQPAFRVWRDFDPSAPGSGAVEVMQSAQVTVVTWNNVRSAGGTGSNEDSRFQMQFWANGTVDLAFAQMTALGLGVLVGFSPGGASSDPGSRDLSATLGIPLALPGADVLPLALTATTRPLLGTTWGLSTDAIPANGTLGVGIDGLADPGIADLALLGLPGCGLRASLDVLSPFVVAGPSHVRGLALPGSTALAGLVLYTTTAVFQSPPSNAFGAITSNGVAGTLGTL